MKDVTVVIPVYNSKKYIKRCIDSVLIQTVKNYKILLINDGSTDNSLKIIEDYKNKYPNIISIVNQENMGVAKTRNKAIELATTKYIMFIDNDDYIDNDYIEEFYKNIKNTNNKVVIGGYKRTNQKDEIIEYIKLNPLNYFDRLKVTTPWARIIDRNFLIENNIRFLDNNIGEDIYFDLLINFTTNDIKVINYSGYNWFYNDFSVSNTIQKDQKKLDIFKLLNSCYDELEKRNLIKDNYEIIEAFFFRYIIWFLYYTTKNISYSELSQIYDKLFIWLKERFPRYLKNKYVSLSNPKGEKFKDRLLYYLLKITNKFKLGKKYLYLYNKRK